MADAAIRAVQLTGLAVIAALTTWFMIGEQYNLFVSLSLGMSAVFIVVLVYCLFVILQTVLRDMAIDTYVWCRRVLGYGYPDD